MAGRLETLQHGFAIDLPSGRRNQFDWVRERRKDYEKYVLHAEDQAHLDAHLKQDKTFQTFSLPLFITGRKQWEAWEESGGGLTRRDKAQTRAAIWLLD